MLDKPIRKRCFKQTFTDLSEQIWHLRCAKRLSLADLAILTKIPLHQLEALENNGYPLNVGTLSQLASFYDKRIKIELVDVTFEK